MNKLDFLIIGGGIVGLSIARELHKRGAREITVLERGEAGKEASWAAAGMLSPDIESSPDGHFYRLCRRSLSMYRQFANDLFDETGVDIELDRAGTLALSVDQKEERPNQMRKILEALAVSETSAIGPCFLYGKETKSGNMFWKVTGTRSQHTPSSNPTNGNGDSPKPATTSDEDIPF